MEANQLPKSHSNNDNAAGSLHTTATDYARFLMACMNNPEFMTMITTPHIQSMERDKDAQQKNIDSDILKPIDWGLGFGLQKNDQGEVEAAFHWGHGPGARTFFVVR